MSIKIRLDGPGRAVAFPGRNRLLAVDERGRGEEHIWGSEELIDEICSRLPINMSPCKWCQYFGSEPYQPTCPQLATPDETKLAG